ncbi:DUF6610 family protein [Haloferax sp. Q22]|uniref:DUF6610 family protein n=1 Tax=Haloferax sp. (strain Q22) TaxID=1526048 RepID=UPI000737B53F|nr:DUF6610 family protein [Haloferax sp. Q22]
MKLGYLPGNREDSNYQLSEEHVNVDIFEGFMDNDYEDPDLDRFLEEWRERRPQVAVIGDAYTREEAERYQQVIDELVDEFPYRRFIVAPKCQEAFDVLDPESTTLGYANGDSPIQAEDLGPAKFRDWDVHLLGGNPHEAYNAIQKLTQPTLDDSNPANVVGYDCNLPLRMAHWEYWTPEGWQDNGSMTPRETARRSYEEIKSFLQEREIWPETEPVELYGEPTEEPDEYLWMDDGGDPITSLEELEKAYVDEYEDKGKLAFRSESQKKFTEYREGLINRKA